MLHCTSKVSKTHNKPDLKIRGEASSQNVKIEYKIKKESSTDDTCRICLKDGKFPIFGDNSSKELCESIYEIGAVVVLADDPYPKYLCQECHAQLQAALLFRKTAQKSDVFLKKRKETITKPEPISETDEPDGDTYEIPIEQNVESTKWYGAHPLSTELKNKKVTCHICKNTYAHQYLKRHMIYKHKRETTHMCDKCGKEFAEKWFLMKHRTTHFYDLPYKCASCPYRSRLKESLKMHIRSHTGERPYQCEQCPSRFISKSNLNKHTLTHGKHDFHCEVCGCGFYTKRVLELHIKKEHTSAAEHVCYTCGKAFGYRKLLMKHERSVHKREKLKSGRMPIYLKVETMKQQNVEAAMEKEEEETAMES